MTTNKPTVATPGAPTIPADFHATTVLRQAQTAGEQGDTPTALKLYESLAERALTSRHADPDERQAIVQALVALGLHTKSRHQLAQSVRYWDLVLLLDPTKEVAYLQRGIVRSRQRQDFLALEDLTQAIAMQCEAALYHRGLVHLHREHPKEALHDFDQYLAHNGNDPWAWYHHGLALSKLNDHTRAIDSLNQAIRLDPDLIEGYAQRGVWRYRLGALDAARDDFDQALVLGPSFTAFYHRGLLNQRERKHVGAVEDFTKALALQEARPEARQARGVSYNALGQYAQAIQDLNLAFFGNAKDAATYGQRGLAYFHLNQWPKALDDLNQAIKLDPQLATNWLRRGQVLLEMNRYTDAEASLTRGIELAPQEAQGHTEMGRLWMVQHQWFQAIAACSAALERNPHSITALLIRAKSHARLHLYDRSVSDYDAVLALEPRNTLALLQRGMIHYRTQNNQLALEDFRNAVAAAPEAAMAYHQLALTLMQLKRYDEALDAIGQALQQQPNHPTYIRRRGQIAMRLQQWDKAEVDLKTALELAPNDSAVHRDLGLLHAQLDRRTEAISHLTRALELNPHDHGASQNLQRLQSQSTGPQMHDITQHDDLTNAGIDTENFIRTLKSGDDFAVGPDLHASGNGGPTVSPTPNNPADDSEEWTQSWPAIR